jgi:hypothetical protein
MKAFDVSPRCHSCIAQIRIRNALGDELVERPVAGVEFSQPLPDCLSFRIFVSFRCPL